MSSEDSARVLATRRTTIALARALEVEDWVLQSMPDASPVKWHLARRPGSSSASSCPARRRARRRVERLVQLVLRAVGKRVARPEAACDGPTVKEVLAYRAAIDRRLADLEARRGSTRSARPSSVPAGTTRQHRELLLTDVKSTSWRRARSPPAYRTGHRHIARPPAPPTGETFDGGVARSVIAAAASFDNGRPAQGVSYPFSSPPRMVTRSGRVPGLHRRRRLPAPGLWLSDGWAWIADREGPLILGR